jgi:two-component system OmpR family response regulator
MQVILLSGSIESEVDALLLSIDLGTFLSTKMPNIRTLCVDDIHDCADSLAMLLSTMGMDAETCYSGRSALMKNEEFRPEVCFVDLNMPGMDGDELAKQLRERGRWNPKVLIAMTARSDAASRVRIAEAGFDLHLVKPLAPDKLSETIEMVATIMQSHRAIDEVSNGERPPDLVL